MDLGQRMREWMLAGELSIADDPYLARDSARAQRLTPQITTIDPTDPGPADAVVGAGSVVLRDLPARGVGGRVAGRVVRTL